MDDFGRILNQWEGSDLQPQNDLEGEVGTEDFSALLDRYPPGKSASDGRNAHNASGNKPKPHPRSWPIDETIDLHGMNAQQARRALSLTFQQAIRNGKRKILIIHGKGLHSSGNPVLKQTVYKFLDSHPRAGMREIADRKSGGSGAVWVILK